LFLHFSYTLSSAKNIHTLVNSKTIEKYRN
jgi:hypothetical protein